VLLPDIVNGGFELSGGLFILNHIRVLLKQKRVAGISLLSNLFFLSWGFWNLFYYPHLGQWVSFAGGIFLSATSCLYNILLWHYGRKN